MIVVRTPLFLILLVPLLAACGKRKQDEPVEAGATLRVYDIGDPIEGAARPDRGQTPNHDVLVGGFAASGAEAFGGHDDHFIAEVVAKLEVKREGHYEFRVRTGGSALLQVGGRRHEIDGGGVVEARLGKGLQRVTLYYTHNEGEPTLELTWRPSGTGEYTALSPLQTPAGVTRVVAPGRKRVYGVAQPGHGAPLEKLHPGWQVRTIRPDWFQPLVGAMALLPDGRLAVATFPPAIDGFAKPILEQADHKIYALGSLDAGSREDIEVKEIARGLVEPCGLHVADGFLYVSGRHEITRLSDPDGDGYFDRHETLASGWNSDNFHHFTFGLVKKEGFLYAALSTAIDQQQERYSDLGVVGRSGPNGPMRGSVIRVPIDQLGNTSPEVVASGFRTPNGIGVGPRGGILVCDNQGAWLSASELNRIGDGTFHGHYNPVYRGKNGRTAGHPGAFEEKPTTRPVAYFPHGRIGLSPSIPVVLPSGPFAGQLLIGDVTYGGLRRVFLDEVDGEVQGCAFRHSQGLESGVNRLVVDEAGALYVGGTGSSGNWGWRGTTAGLQKLEPTGVVVHEFESIRATAKGFVVRFTKPVPGDQLASTANYRIRSHRYLPTPAYGGVGYRKQDHRIVVATPSEDGREVELELEGLHPESVVHFITSPASVDGEPIWSSEAWYTLNRIPGQSPRTVPAWDPAADPEFDHFIEAGFRGWGFGGAPPRPWSYEAGAFRFHPFDELRSGLTTTRRPISGNRIEVDLRCSGEMLRPWFRIGIEGRKPVVVHFGIAPADLEDGAKVVEIEPGTGPAWQWRDWFDREGSSEPGGHDRTAFVVDGGNLQLEIGGARHDLGSEAAWQPGQVVEFGLGAAGTRESDDAGAIEFRRIGEPSD